MTFYTLTAPPRRDAWHSYPPEQEQEYDRQLAAHRADLAAMLTEAFKPCKVLSAESYRPSVDLTGGDGSTHSSDVVEVTFSTNSYLRLTARWAYKVRMWRQIQVTVEGGSDGAARWVLSRQRVNDAAKALMEGYALYKARKQANEDYVTAQRAAEAEAFSKLRLQLEAAGIVFSTCGAGGGIVLLEGGNELGARLEVLGGTVNLKLWENGRETMQVRPELVPAMVELFGRNAATGAQPV